LLASSTETGGQAQTEKIGKSSAAGENAAREGAEEAADRKALKVANTNQQDELELMGTEEAKRRAEEAREKAQEALEAYAVAEERLADRKTQEATQALKKVGSEKEHLKEATEKYLAKHEAYYRGKGLDEPEPRPAKVGEAADGPALLDAARGKELSASLDGRHRQNLPIDRQELPKVYSFSNSQSSSSSWTKGADGKVHQQAQQSQEKVRARRGADGKMHQQVQANQESLKDGQHDQAAIECIDGDCDGVVASPDRDAAMSKAARLVDRVSRGDLVSDAEDDIDPFTQRTFARESATFDSVGDAMRRQMQRQMQNMMLPMEEMLRPLEQMMRPPELMVHW